MISKGCLAFVIGAASLSANGAAYAADSGFYLGFGIGTARASFNDNGVAGAAAGTAVANSSAEIAGKAYGGYQFNKYFGIEAGYADFGKTDIVVTVPGATSVPGNAAISGFGIAAVGTIPSSMGLSLFGKLGGFYSTLDAATSVNIFNSGTTAGSREHKFVPNIGVGVTYDMTANWRLRAEFERFLGVGSDTKTINTDVNMFTVGFNYRF